MLNLIFSGGTYSRCRCYRAGVFFSFFWRRSVLPTFQLQRIFSWPQGKWFGSWVIGWCKGASASWTAPAWNSYNRITQEHPNMAAGDANHPQLISLPTFKSCWTAFELWNKSNQWNETSPSGLSFSYLALSEYMSVSVNSKEFFFEPVNSKQFCTLSLIV
jgi:hypothetical protein